MPTNHTHGHTPGEWETSRDAVPEGHVQITVYAVETGERVATVFQRAANARLIAAAPELLWAVERIAAVLGPNGFTKTERERSIDAWRDDVSAILAKARAE